MVRNGDDFVGRSTFTPSFMDGLLQPTSITILPLITNVTIAPKVSLTTSVTYSSSSHSGVNSSSPSIPVGFKRLINQPRRVSTVKVASSSSYSKSAMNNPSSAGSGGNLKNEVYRVNEKNEFVEKLNVNSDYLKNDITTWWTANILKLAKPLMMCGTSISCEPNCKDFEKGGFCVLPKEELITPEHVWKNLPDSWLPHRVRLLVALNECMPVQNCAYFINTIPMKIVGADSDDDEFEILFKCSHLNFAGRLDTLPPNFLKQPIFKNTAFMHFEPIGNVTEDEFIQTLNLKMEVNLKHLREDFLKDFGIFNDFKISVNLARHALHDTCHKRTNVVLDEFVNVDKVSKNKVEFDSFIAVQKTDDVKNDTLIAERFKVQKVKYYQ